MSEVFISYSHYDKFFLTDLKKHFKPFINKISFWDDTKILAGEEWEKKIKTALESCKIAILLISADFFNSDFIEKNELPILLDAAEKKGTTILSVILKPCLFSEYPEINKYQAINSPSNSIIQMSEFEREQTWVDLMKRIKNILL
ncbi:MAG: toll/interleukin receptor protein [Chitinophagaceae bacterium]|nr:toll/interleukin receptor protein [Chitinophagaceae bacterium]